MPLLQIFSKSPEQVFQLGLPQVIALCGSGQLSDGSACAEELRTFLRQAPSAKLFTYAEACLAKSFDKSGLALQDIVNELGRRLDYQVTNGLYQGRSNAIGFDGIWKAPDGKSLVVEVKTTDAYRINLDSIAAYRHRLISSNEVANNASILIVVGRQDTGDLEAQVRGSRHAWDIRLISVDGLTKLVKLKEETEEDTVLKIRELLTPFEYTRVDKIIEIAFTATVEATASESEPAPSPDSSSQHEHDEEGQSTQDHTPRSDIEQKREEALAALALREKNNLVKRSRATFWSPDDEHRLRAACSISKRHKSGHYWYAYHPAWDDFLKGASEGSGYFILGCIDSDVAFAIPRNWLIERLPFLNRTEVSESKFYWHIHLEEDEQGIVGLKIHKKSIVEPMTAFALQLS